MRSVLALAFLGLLIGLGVSQECILSNSSCTKCIVYCGDSGEEVSNDPCVIIKQPGNLVISRNSSVKENLIFEFQDYLCQLDGFQLIGSVGLGWDVSVLPSPLYNKMKFLNPIIKLDNIQSFKMTGTEFTQTEYNTQGVFLINNITKFQLVNSQFNNITVKAAGSAIYAQKSGLYLDSVNFTNCLAYNQPGGAIFLGEQNKLYAYGKTIEISSNQGTLGGFLVASGLNNTVQFDVDRIVFFNNSATNGGVFYFPNRTNTTKAPIDSLIINSRYGIEIIKNRANQNGGFLWGDQAKIFMETQGKLSIKDNRAGQSGGVFFLYSQLQMSLSADEDIEISTNTVGDSGSFLYKIFVKNSVVFPSIIPINITTNGSIIIQENNSSKDGAFYVSDYFNLQLIAKDSINILNNSGNNSAFCLSTFYTQQIVSSQVLLKGRNLKFSGNRSPFFLNLNVTMKIEASESLVMNKNIYNHILLAQQNKVEIISQGTIELSETVYSSQGGFAKLNNLNTLRIYALNSLVIQNFVVTLTGGFLQMSQSNVVKIQSDGILLFKENQAREKQGGVFFSDGTNELEIYSKSTLSIMNNSALGQDYYQTPMNGGFYYTEYANKLSIVSDGKIYIQDTQRSISLFSFGRVSGASGNPNYSIRSADSIYFQNLNLSGPIFNLLYSLQPLQISSNQSIYFTNIKFRDQLLYAQANTQISLSCDGNLIFQNLTAAKSANYTAIFQSQGNSSKITISSKGKISFLNTTSQTDISKPAANSNDNMIIFQNGAFQIFQLKSSQGVVINNPNRRIDFQSSSTINNIMSTEWVFAKDNLFQNCLYSCQICTNSNTCEQCQRGKILAPTFDQCLNPLTYSETQLKRTIAEQI